MTVGRICSRPVPTTTPGRSVQDAAVRMLRHDVDTLMVVDEHGAAVGVITDRDIVLRCIARAHDPMRMSVEEVMSRIVEGVPSESAVYSGGGGPLSPPLSRSRSPERPGPGGE